MNVHRKLSGHWLVMPYFELMEAIISDEFRFL